MSIIISGQRCILTLPRKEDPKEFKRAMESKRKSEIKSYCEETYTSVQSKIFQMQTRHIPLSIENLKKFIQSGFCDTYTLGMLWQDWESIISSRVSSGDLTKDVYKKYTWAWQYFLSNSGASEEMEATSVSSAEILRFTTWLTGKYQNQTVIGIYRKIQTIFKFAFDSGKIPSNPCALVKIKKQKKEAIYLTEKELETIQFHDYKNVIVGAIDPPRAFGKHQAKAIDIPVTTICYKNDIVPSLPMWYHHAGDFVQLGERTHGLSIKDHERATTDYDLIRVWFE